ncbi:hypothetical protein [Rhodobacter sp. TJ_12]|uniref:hypothetical protein n=1 Tax=Rhodobacter sp. TJ_12 TaxID=2029399 RepID=UPI001CBC5FED|nr:hypothetical protein [Rhodobacter sp. TJ_12]
MESKAMRVLVLGFSVTAEKNGYVEAAAERLAADGLPRPIDLRKVGLGGFHPSNLPPLIDYILDREKPDAVVFEIATSSFRNQTNADLNHPPILAALLNACHTRNLPCAFLDLPRTDVEFATDWVVTQHGDACRQLGLPHAAVAPSEGMFKDVVHPTPDGIATLSDALLALLRDLVAEPLIVPKAIAASGRQSCFAFSRVLAPGAGRRFERAGLEFTCAELHPGQPLHIKLPQPTRIIGLMAIAGPRSGQIRVAVPQGEARTVQPYDPYCYYERMYPMRMAPFMASELVLQQLPGVPEVDLLKGEKDTGPRIGYLAALFTSYDTDPAQGLKL